MSLVTINGAVMALNGIPVDIQPAAPDLQAPTVNIISITEANPSAPVIASVQITNRDSNGTSIQLVFFVPSTFQTPFTVNVANANATVAANLPAGYVLNGQTLSVRGSTLVGADSSNPSAISSMVFTSTFTGGTLPANLPFSL